MSKSRLILVCSILLIYLGKINAIACDPGTYDNGAGACANCDLTKCLECDTSPTKCTACADGKFLQDPTCATCPTGCQTCRNSDICLTCTQGFVLASTKCITESQARSSSSSSSSSGLHYGWIIAITAGGAIILALAIWGLWRFLKKKPSVQKLDDTFVKPPQETIDLFKALFSAQNNNASPNNPSEGTNINNTSAGESNSLKTGTPMSKEKSKGGKGGNGQSDQPANLGALFGGMMSTKQKSDEVGAPKIPPPFLMAMGNIPGFSSGKQKDVFVDSQKPKAKAPTTAPSFK